MGKEELHLPYIVFCLLILLLTIHFANADTATSGIVLGGDDDLIIRTATGWRYAADEDLNAPVQEEQEDSGGGGRSEEEEQAARLRVSAAQRCPGPTLAIEVRNGDGEAVRNALCTIDGKRVTTDADGQASLELEPGTYTLEVSKPGMSGRTATITITSCEEASTPPHSVSEPAPRGSSSSNTPPSERDAAGRGEALAQGETDEETDESSEGDSTPMSSSEVEFVPIAALPITAVLLMGVVVVLLFIKTRRGKDA